MRLPGGEDGRGVKLLVGGRDVVARFCDVPLVGPPNDLPRPPLVARPVLDVVDALGARVRDDGLDGLRSRGVLAVLRGGREVGGKLRGRGDAGDLFCVYGFGFGFFLSVCIPAIVLSVSFEGSRRGEERGRRAASRNAQQGDEREEEGERKQRGRGRGRGFVSWRPFFFFVRLLLVSLLARSFISLSLSVAAFNDGSNSTITRRRTCHGILNGRRWSRRESAEPALSAIELMKFALFLVSFLSFPKVPRSSDTQS